LEQRVALIPGGARGIGCQIALALAQRGWGVAVAYRKSADDAERTVAAACQAGAEAWASRADVSVPEQADALVRETLARFGRVDALIQCAGPFRRVPLLQETPEGWRAMFEQNLHPLFYLARAVAPGMMERRWGRIIGFGVVNADRIAAQPNVTAYVSAKTGVLVLVKTLARLLAPYGITANAISPGVLDTGGLPPEELDALRAQIPAGYVGDPGDAAHAALYLLSDEAAYVNGTNLQLSGGWGL
jgi:3-oxoacyl-[acyl-carrier protein] reductase